MQVFVVRMENADDEMVMEILKGMFIDKRYDFITEIDDKRVVLLKRAELMETDPLSFAHIVIENIQAEAMTRAEVGMYGQAVDAASLRHAFINSLAALRIGMTFYRDSRVHVYGSLGMGRLINELPENVCRRYLEEKLKEHAYEIPDEESLKIIRAFQDNDLSIADTARELGMNRNTLVYRLDRISERVGQNIRTFDGAMTFKLATMIRLHLAELEKMNSEQ